MSETELFIKQAREYTRLAKENMALADARLVKALESLSPGQGVETTFDGKILVDGKVRILMGASEMMAIHIWKNQNGFTWKKMLDALISHKNNSLRVWLDHDGVDARISEPDQFGNAQYRYTQRADHRWELGILNETFFNRADEFFSYTDEHKIVCFATMFNPWSAKKFWNESPSNHDNNTEDEIGAGYYAPFWFTLYEKTENARIKQLQVHMINKIADLLKKHPYVIPEINNEGDGKYPTTEWMKWCIRQLRAAMQERGFERPIAICDSYTPYSGRAEKDHDINCWHTGGSLDPAFYEQKAKEYDSYGKPGICGEFYVGQAPNWDPGNWKLAADCMAPIPANNNGIHYADWSTWRQPNSQAPFGILEAIQELVERYSW